MKEYNCWGFFNSHKWGKWKTIHDRKVADIDNIKKVATVGGNPIEWTRIIQSRECTVCGLIQMREEESR